MYVLIDESGRICATTDVEEYATGMEEFDFPDDFDFSHQGDYRLVDGELVYDGAQTAAEETARQEAERRATIDAGAAEYFADGGKQAMEQSIRDAAASGGADPQLKALGTQVTAAKAKADEAKAKADTVAASMNEYLDAILGLDATDETEATDAE